jgi:hypothetical protein
MPRGLEGAASRTFHKLAWVSKSMSFRSLLIFLSLYPLSQLSLFTFCFLLLLLCFLFTRYNFAESKVARKIVPVIMLHGVRFFAQQCCTKNRHCKLSRVTPSQDKSKTRIVSCKPNLQLRK